MTTDLLSAYARLLQMVEREHSLIAAGEWDALVHAGEERAALVAELPPRPPLDARDLIEATQHQLAVNATAIDAARARTGQKIAGMRTGRCALRGYSTAPAYARVDVRS